MIKKIERRSIPSDVSPIEGLPEFLSRIYLARGIKHKDELNLNLKDLVKPNLLKGLDKAIELLVEALHQQQKIMVVGDFDADGATSTALCVHALRNMGASQCDYLVPNRFEFGYGLSPEIVELAAKSKPDLLITVDNGISSIEGVSRAHDLGMKVIVTDHHLPGELIPDADAIVNPNQAECGFLSKNAAGVGVIFYVMSALKTTLSAQGWFTQRALTELNMADYLDLVALGTIADLVPLDRNNRILAEQGLRRMRAGHCRPGIQAILNQAQKRITHITASDIGFLIGPRLNAAGRLDDMSLGIECLLAQDPLSAETMAQRLDQLNRERKLIEDDMRRDAEVLLDSVSEQENEEHWGVTLYEAHWHQGVIGILASRIKDRLNRPVVVFAPESDDPSIVDPVLKGSARSIKSFHMRDGLDLVAKRNPGLLSKFGGHAMAAGMSIYKSQLADFVRAFDEVVRDVLRPADLEAIIETDGELSESDLDLNSIEMLKRAGPWGQAFPEPCFDGRFKVVQFKVLKEKHLKLVLTSLNGSQLFDAIQFNSDWVKRNMPDEISIVYRPDINEFRGRRNVQLIIDYIDEV